MIKSIKVKKQMRLDELIKYIFDKDITGRRFEERSDYKSYSITHAVHVRGNGVMNVEGLFNPDTKFTVEVKEEITEDTVFDSLIEITADGGYIDHGHNISVSDVKGQHSIRFYTPMNKKLELIWESESDEGY